MLEAWHSAPPELSVHEAHIFTGSFFGLEQVLVWDLRFVPRQISSLIIQNPSARVFWRIGQDSNPQHPRSTRGALSFELPIRKLVRTSSRIGNCEQVFLEGSFNSIQRG